MRIDLKHVLTENPPGKPKWLSNLHDQDFPMIQKPKSVQLSKWKVVITFKNSKPIYQYFDSLERALIDAESIIRNDSEIRKIEVFEIGNIKPLKVFESL